MGHKGVVSRRKRHIIRSVLLQLGKKQCKCLYDLDTDLPRLRLGGQLLDHQYGSSACAGIARCL